MDTIRVMLPIIVMLVMGVIIQRTGFISEDGMNGIKIYLTKIALPVTIFHAMATADLGGQTLYIIITMFVFLAIAMVIGFLLRPLIEKPYKKYLPFVICLFEGGMLSYPLYENLCGADKLVNVVIVDIAGCIFGFGIFYGILSLVEKGTKFSFKTMGKVAIMSPTFDAVVLGLLCNLTGVMGALLDNPVSELYIVIKDIAVAPLTSLILLYVGYSIKIEKGLIKVCLKSIALRMIVMTILGTAVLFILRDTMKDIYMLTAFLIMFVTSPSFSMAGFVDDKDAAGYFAMSTSLYVIITVIGYGIITVTLF
ncbi:MAG: hypothetical protein E7265_09555 [Lachnospiraceae bacterium]|nr:hypothetical protein [Lachnospiraceae bacterium]